MCNCSTSSRAYYSLDLSANLGLVLPSPAPPVEIGGGLNWYGPYGSLYVQLHNSEQRDYGIGIRGLPTLEVIDQHLFGRYDLVLSSGRRILYSPGVYYRNERAYSRNQMLAFVQSIGTEKPSGHWTFRPAATLVLARGRYEEENVFPESLRQNHTFRTAFAVLSVGLVLHSVAAP